MTSRGLPVLFLASLLTASAVAGCIAGDPSSKPVTGDGDLLSMLSQPVYDTIEKLHMPVPGHDGKMQDTWVFKPQTDDPNATFPVFINFSPYWSNLAPSAESGGDAFSQHMIEYFVPRGYAIVLASVRGTGNSEGCFPIGGITELEDAYAVIDHFAKVEWSNGNVGSGGKSYDGTTIQGVAGYKPHPALKLVFPVSGISDLYRYNYRGGVPYGQGPIFNAYYYAGVGVNQGNPTGQGTGALIDDVACADLPFVQGHGVATGVHGLYNDYWNERNYIRYAPDVQTAFFYVHGFQDWNVKPDHILPWLTALPEGTVKKAYLHQWADGNDGHVYPMRDDWNLTMHRVMDQYLLGIDTGIESEPAFHVQDSSGAWRTETTWPPADVTIRSLHPHEDNTLADTPGTGTGGAYATPMTAQPLFEWSVTLNETLHYAGMPVFKARLATTDPYTAWVVQLWKEKDGERTWMNEGVLRAYLRDSMEMPSPVVPGQMHDYAIEFYPQDDVFPAGSKLIVTLGTGGARHALTTPEPAAVQIDRASAVLELPVIDPETRTWEDPQPQEIPCFAC